MALLQTDHDNVAWLTGSPLSRHASPSNASRTSASISLHRSGRSLETLRQWSMRRQVRAWRTRTELARQRRALAQLSDRELRDIGITRYEIEFVLRQSPWR
jgi:uncharacterized protein YjiS (DUF1127 family)